VDKAAEQAGRSMPMYQRTSRSVVCRTPSVADTAGGRVYQPRVSCGPLALAAHLIVRRPRSPRRIVCNSVHVLAVVVPGTLGFCTGSHVSRSDTGNEPGEYTCGYGAYVGRLLLSALLVLMFGAGALNAQSSPNDDHLVVSTGKVSLVADRSLAGEASRYAADADQSMKALAHEWGAPTEEHTVLICMYGDRSQFIRACRPLTTPTESLDGFTYQTQQGVVVIVDASGPSEAVGVTLRHEIAHAALALAVGQHAVQIPYWFSEGLATLVERSAAENSKLARDAAAREQRVPTVEQLEQELSGLDDHSGNAAIYAADLVAYCEHALGTKWIGQILSLVKDGCGFPEAFRRATGASAEELASNWRADLQQRLDRRERLSTILFIAVTVLLLALYGTGAYLVRRRRRGRDREGPGSTTSADPAQ
jgi:hypothetical protein